MNTSQILNIIIPTLAALTAASVSKFGISPDAWGNWLLTLGTLIAGIVAHFMHADPAASTPPSKSTITKVLCLLAFGCLALSFTGCTTVYTSGCITTVQTRVFGLSIEATSTSTGTPAIQLGACSSLVQISPTSTNGPIFDPNFFSTAQSTVSYNPFDVGLSESIGMGDVAASIGTNGTSNASTIIPKLSK